MKGKESKSVLQLVVSGWKKKNKVMATESDRRLAESGP